MDRLPVGRLSIRQASLSKLEGVWKRLKSHRRFTMATAAINSDQPVGCVELAMTHRSASRCVFTTCFGAELADPPLHLLVDGEGRIAALVRGAGQDAINRIAAQVQRWLEEMEPLGNTRFARTNPAGLALQWTEPPG